MSLHLTLTIGSRIKEEHGEMVWLPDGRLRCQSDVKRNGYWTNKQCKNAASARLDGEALCPSHRNQRERWALAAQRPVVVEDLQ